MAPRTRKKEHVNSKPSEKDSAEKSRGKKRKVDEEVENTDKGKKGKTAAEPTVKTPDDKFTHWLIKSEPETRIEKGVDMRFSFEDLKQEENSTACWDGVRNYQARNFMRMMKVGEQAFFYHSNTKPPGIIGMVEIVREAYPDHTQFDSKDPHFDPKSKQEDPRWDMVDVKYVQPIARYIPLDELKRIHLKHKASNGPLRNIALFTKARLSVQPLTKEEWDFILQLQNEKPT